MIGILLIVFGLVLYDADRRPQRKSLEAVDLRQGLYIGLAQVPGAVSRRVSRSGITITAGRYMGFDRDSAARISFLMLVPVTAGAVLFKGYQAIVEGLPDGVVGPIIVGIIASAISGFLAIAGLLKFVRTHSYDGFVIYRVIAGTVVLLLIATGVRDATF